MDDVSDLPQGSVAASRRRAGPRDGGDGTGALPDDDWDSLYPAGDVAAAPTFVYDRQVEAKVFLQHAWQSTTHAAWGQVARAVSRLPRLGDVGLAQNAQAAVPPSLVPPRSLAVRGLPLAAAAPGAVGADHGRGARHAGGLPDLREMLALEARLQDLRTSSSTLTFEMFCYLNVIAADRGVAGDPWQKPPQDLQGAWRRLMLQLHPDKLSPELDRQMAARVLTQDEAQGVVEVAKVTLTVFDLLLHHLLPDPRLRAQADAHRQRHPYLTAADMRLFLRLKRGVDDIAPGLLEAGRIVVGACETTAAAAVGAAQAAHAVWVVTTPLRADIAAAAVVGAGVGARQARRIGRGIIGELFDMWRQLHLGEASGPAAGRRRRPGGA